MSSNLVRRKGIAMFQDAMQREIREGRATAQVCEATHHFPPGMYCREMMIPEGTVIIGKLHRHAHMNTVSHGLLLVATEFDSYEVHAPYSFISEPGTKRVVTALTDVVWTTYHLNPTNTTDLAELEQAIIAKDYTALEGL